MAAVAFAGYGSDAPEDWFVVPAAPDAEFVAAMADGDRSALATLYDRHAGLMLGLGLRVLRDRGEAEEVLHDVFVEAFRGAATYDPARGSVRTWLFLRMRSRSLDRLKSGARSRSVPLDDLTLERAPAPSPSVTGDERRLAEVLAQLPHDQRVVIELAYFEGLSSGEISTRLGVPMGTVKSRTAAALSKLRAAMLSP